MAKHDTDSDKTNYITGKGKYVLKELSLHHANYNITLTYS